MKAYQFFHLQADKLNKEFFTNDSVDLKWQDILKELEKLGYIVLLGQGMVNGVHTMVGLGCEFADQILANIKVNFYQLAQTISAPFMSGEFYVERGNPLDALDDSLGKDFARAVEHQVLHHLRARHPVHGIIGEFLVETRVVKVFSLNEQEVQS